MKKQFIKIAGITLTAALMLGTMSITIPNAQAAKTPFSDVQSTHWGAGAITNGVSKGYVDGYTNGTFKPDASVTRAEFMKMVVSAMELETTPSAVNGTRNTLIPQAKQVFSQLTILTITKRLGRK
ncbi:hypothetical protein PAEAM_39180 [Paenibacillus sp. GM1FR]|uniref:S-layer homology domain-containing protein n=1 Tax=Paenibacillus sp. GM1FR TaxID=2059267 RepID=UPI000CB7C0CD|nr:S-layer homology domain-containing protein [Paenibacillus sp. GM1FR]PJN57811.1 hypothetical protein PAEAM_39180 [Paenibacillus sp. GM1FR]